MKNAPIYLLCALTLAGTPPTAAASEQEKKPTPYYFAAEAQVWLPMNNIFSEGGGLIEAGNRVQFMGFRLKGARSISENDRHWLYASLSYGLGTFKKTPRVTQSPEVPTHPVSPYYSDHLLSGNDLMQLGLTAGYEYTLPITDKLSLIGDAYAGINLVGIFDNYKGYHDINDPYYEENFQEENWADNMDLGLATGISLGLQYQFTPRFFSKISYGIEFQTSNPEYQFSNGATVRTRHTTYQTITVSFGLKF